MLKRETRTGGRGATWTVVVVGLCFDLDFGFVSWFRCVSNTYTCRGCCQW